MRGIKTSEVNVMNWIVFKFRLYSQGSNTIKTIRNKVKMNSEEKTTILRSPTAPSPLTEDENKQQDFIYSMNSWLWGLWLLQINICEWK